VLIAGNFSTTKAFAEHGTEIFKVQSETAEGAIS
jgi:hypothetical protein